jgi:hypothetical protein
VRALVKLTALWVMLEVVCVAIVHSPLRAHVAAVAGQTQIANGEGASPLVAVLVIGAQMAATTLIPVAAIACILHICGLHCVHHARMKLAVRASCTHDGCTTHTCQT